VGILLSAVQVAFVRVVEFAMLVAVLSIDSWLKRIVAVELVLVSAAGHASDFSFALPLEYIEMGRKLVTVAMEQKTM